MNNLNKKGVSGLIVAVLLLAVALTIGGLVMGWISGYTDDNLASSSESQEEQDECFKRSFKIISVNSTGPQGGTDGWATVIVENKKNEIIKGFLFKIIGDGDELFAFEQKNTTNSLSAYVRNTYVLDGNTLNTASNNSFSIGTAAYNVSKVEVIPIIDIVVDTTKEVVCTSKLKKVEDDAFVNTQ